MEIDDKELIDYIHRIKKILEQVKDEVKRHKDEGELHTQNMGDLERKLAFTILEAPGAIEDEKQIPRQTDH